MEFKGKAHKFGDDINTDYIMSSRHRTQTLDYVKLAEHLMEDIRPGFYSRVKAGDFIVAGENFGCGSSREYAPRIVKAGGIAAVIAKSFARIFYRNAINLGLPLIECDTDQINEGDTLRVDLLEGEVYNETLDCRIQAGPMPEFMITLLNEGGTANYLRKYGKFQVPKEQGLRRRLMAENLGKKAVLFEDEVLRDGLQMETRLFSFEEKVKIFQLLAEAKVKRVQIGSFVHPKLVPQMADTDALIRHLGHTPGILLSGLILNDKGLERALACGLAHLSMSVSVSDTHSRKNANRSAQEALASMTLLIAEAKKAGVQVRAGIQCAFGCVYEGTVPADAVFAAAEAMAHAGADEINLADTTGMGNPRQVRSLVQGIGQRFPGMDVSLHLHDTRGLGLANMFAGYEEGVRIFDVCAGGLGGCPFVKGAAGNVPTEDAVNMFESMGIETGVDLGGMTRVVDELELLLGRPLPGRMTRVLKAQLPCNAA